ncbi:hypothetical protein O6H91_17G015600 [Diphasiastrum complanatum]|uniref:Uncharacterized protein n=2 Tax=Diphasiastrum complanatum TaxID=34168 RepID=A0ACC2B4M0_DIPCM|nr:hypothetical protein O6H91_17G015600 [Diphasiastrum complanatum]
MATICRCSSSSVQLRPSFSQLGRGATRRFGQVLINCMPKRPSGKLQQHASMQDLANQRKRPSISAMSESDTEQAFKNTAELDRLINTLRDSDNSELSKLVAENVLAFDTNFWLRLATRTELCESSDDKLDYEELASNLMKVIERLVQKTEEKIDSSTDVLKSVLRPITTELTEEIVWPPPDARNLALMKKELLQREQEGYLDESFLSEVNAQLRQAKEDKDKPGLVAMLQRVLQLYAARVLSKRSYAKKDKKVDEGEQLLETIISVEEESWNDLLRTGLLLGGGNVEAEDFSRVISKRIERTLMRTDSGSYTQRVLVEYLKEIEKRYESLVEAFKASPQN